MSIDDFWNGNPRLAKSYRDAYTKSMEAHNQEMWWQGFYIYEAVGIVIKNALRKKGDKTIDYPSEPHRITPYSEEELQANAEREREKFINSMNAFKKAWDKQHG